MLSIYKVAEGPVRPHPVAVADVAAVLRAGGLALLPTETVYGIGVSVAAFASAHAEGSGAAVGTGAAALPVPGPGTGYGRIFTLKQRELTQTVPWLVDGPEALDIYGAGVAPEVCALASAFWPGALTLVVNASPRVPAFMRAADGTVALRASGPPVIQALIKACGSPLAVTSANTHGAPAPAAFADVEPRILAGVDVAVDAGATSCRDASTIVSFERGELQIIRQGALSAARIEAALAHVPHRPAEHA